jgi:NADH-quinone oxidoreductase subunit H
MGLDEEGSPKSGGLLVGSVDEGRAAAQAGIRKGDLLLSFNGVTVTGITDLIAHPGARVATIGVKRGTTETMLLEMSTKDVKPNVIPNDVLAAIILLVVAGVVLVLFMAPTAGIITWFERRVSGRMQSRVGPNRAGPQGVLIWLADGLKSFMKEDVIPTDVDKPLFRLAPYLVFTGVSATFVVMPFGQYLISADLDIGILFIVAVTSLVAIGLLTGGWASNNKWSLIGGIRAAAQVISYEIPSAIAIVCVVMMTGSLRMQDIIGAQGGVGTIAGGLHDILTTGGWPWYWYVCRNPVSFALFFLFFTTALAEGNRAPFDMPEAESELVAGYSTEYSGFRYVVFFFAEWANVFVMSGIASALFLGGWQIPGVSPAAQEANIWLQLLGVVVFLVKSWILIFVVVWVRWTLPRIRVDQLMAVCWKWLVPLSFAGFMLTALWVLGTTQPIVRGVGAGAVSSPLISDSVQLGIGLAMFAVSLAILVHFVRRVHYNLKNARVPIHVNPFL